MSCSTKPQNQTKHAAVQLGDFLYTTDDPFSEWLVINKDERRVMMLLLKEKGKSVTGLLLGEDFDNMSFCKVEDEEHALDKGLQLVAKVPPHLKEWYENDATTGRWKE